MKFIFVLSLILIFNTAPAFAYVGPAAALGAVGSFLAAIAFVLLLILGFLWYPVKKLIRKFKGHPQTAEAETSEKTAAQSKATGDQN